MRSFFEEVAAEACFSAEKMAKVSLADTEHLMIGLNCLEPGQEHAPHAHAGSDKAYYVVSGTGTFVVGEETRRLTAGGLVVAAAGVPHGVRNDGGERLVLLVTISPPIRK